jgi:hypothetical protein
VSTIPTSGNVNPRPIDLAPQSTAGAVNTPGVQTAQQAADLAAQTTLQDQVNLGQLGQEAAVHTGSAQDLAAQARRLGTTREALSAGGVHVGDVAPGEGPAPTDGNPGPAPAPGQPGAPGSPSQSGDPTQPGAPTDPSQPAPAPSGPQTTWATQAQAAQSDAQNAATILQQMAADRQKAMMQIWKIWEDTQTAIFQMMQDTMANRQKVMDACSAAWDQVLRS